MDGIPGWRMPPAPVYEKRLAIVATSKPGRKRVASSASTAATVRATSGAGTFRVIRGQRKSMARVRAPTAASGQWNVGSARTSTSTRSTKCSGIGPTVRPRRSRTCSVPMTTAMPAVKPAVTG